MDRLESMSTLVAAVEAGSLSAAGRRLRMPLATVSRKVAELEAHLQTRLLHRSARRLTLTDAGQAYLIACKRILEQIAEAERAATGEYSVPKGELVVSAPLVLGRIHVLPIAVEFLQAHPDIDLRLALSDRNSNLLEDHVDVAVRVGELPDSSLIALRVGATGRVVCGSPSYFARRGVPRRPEDLARHDCVAFENVSASNAWSFESKRSSATVSVRARLCVNGAEAAIDAATAGLGVTRVFCYQTLQAERAGTLVRVLRPFEATPMPIHLVHVAQPLLPLKLRAFLDFVAPRLRARLSPPARRQPRRAVG